MNRLFLLFLLSFMFYGCFKKQHTTLLGKYKIVKTENIQVDSNKSVITGFVKDIENNEHVILGSIIVQGTTTGVMIDSTGFFKMTLNPGDYIFEISSLGYSTLKTKKIKLLPNTKMMLEAKLGIQIFRCG